MSQERVLFQNRVKDLVEHVEAWVEPHEWVTKDYEKKMRDDGQVYVVPALFLQKGTTRVLLDPVANDVPRRHRSTEGLPDEWA